MEEFQRISTVESFFGEHHQILLGFIAVRCHYIYSNFVVRIVIFLRTKNLITKLLDTTYLVLFMLVFICDLTII